MCEIAGIKFTNRIWNAPVPVSFRDLKELNESDAGAVVFKTITLNKLEGNPNGWSLHEWGSINNVALHNEGLETAIMMLYELQPIKPVFISIFGTEEELLQIIERLNGVQEIILIEWNTTCPNVEFELKIEETLPKLRAACKHPLGIKISADTPTDLAPVFEKHGVDFIAAINSIGGKGGACIQEKALASVKTWAMITTIPIIGIGGIRTAQDVLAFLNAGAVAAEIGSAFLRKGVRIFNNPCRLKLVPELYTHNIVQQGTFLLKSGILSDFYIDFRRALSIPDLWENIVVQVLEKVKPLEFDAVCGVPTSAIPVAAIIALRRRKPLLLCRKEGKKHGTKKQLEGAFNENWRCLVVEDVITSGSSAMRTIRILEDHNLCVHDIFTLANRSEHSRYGKVRINSLFTLRDLERKEEILAPGNNDALHLARIIDRKKTRLCFSADISNPGRLLSIVEKVAPYICMLKLHTDALDGLPANFRDRLYQLMTQHNFLLLADRKLADIPSIVKTQCEKLQKIAPFTFVTAHLLPGMEILDAIQESNLSAFVVAQMSCNRDDWDPVYMRRSVQIAENHPVVAGLIAQEQLSSTLLHAVPGVGKGRNHRDAEDLEFADILIVGRAIYNAEDPATEAERLSNL